ncbi:MAG: beta-lactamase family protein [Clostridia bacterium]|nr:beta-lactamase family protein [Clostridia bacterium]
MPSTPLKNLVYRAALPFCAPSPYKLMRHETLGQELQHLPYYEHLMVRHHVLGASLLLDDGQRRSETFTTITVPMHVAKPDTLFRVASITKMATALATLSCIAEGCFGLDSPVRALLPDTPHAEVLDGVTVRHLLSHTSGLQDLPAMDAALRDGRPYDDVLAADGVRCAAPGKQLNYSNFGFGLLGCLLENMTGRSVEDVFRQRVFTPLGMRATLDASTLDESRIMPISRVLPYEKGRDVTITALGRKSLSEPDPLRRFGHTAGAMYTDAPSLAKLLRLIHTRGLHDGTRLLPDSLMTEMTSLQSSTATRSYGLGLVLLDRPKL